MPEPHGRVHEHAERVHAAAVLHRPVIHAVMARVRGGTWEHAFAGQLRRYDALVKEFRAAAVGTPILLAFLPEWRRRTSRWRRYMEAIVAEEKRADVREPLRRAVGHGLGTPYSVRAMSRLLEGLVHGAGAFRTQLLALGADASTLELPAQLLAEVEATTRQLGERRKQVGALRALAAAERTSTSAWVDDVRKAARRARAHARVKNDAAAEDAANALLTDLAVARKHALGAVKRRKRVGEGASGGAG